MLIVVDEPSVLALVAAILGSNGYAVMSVPTGHEALRALEEGTFEMIVSDVRMPGLDGRGLFEAVSAR
ncbi:MAG: response regulator [Dehalococcoidia bacterium]|nr:response regulator [Dehalococcoidia bacterium]